MIKLGATIAALTAVAVLAQPADQPTEPGRPAVEPAKPAPPTNPIELTTEIGSAATTDARLRVSVGMTLSVTGTTALVRLWEHDSLFGSGALIHASHLARVAALLDEVSEAALARTSVERQVTEPITLTPEQQQRKRRGYSVRDTREVAKVSSSSNERGDWRVHLYVRSDAIIYKGDFALDPENAAALARLLRRAASNIEWITPRLLDLDLSRPDLPGGPPPPP